MTGQAKDSPNAEALIQRLRALSSVFASMAEYLAGLTSDARLEYGRNELLAWERDGALLMTAAADALASSQEALRAKEQEIASLRAALFVPATYWREYFEAGDGSHSTHDEFWLQWLNEHSEQIQAVLASSGAETP